MGDVLRQERCPKCAEIGRDNSGDNLSVYDDGVHCHACGYSSTTGDTTGPSTPKADDKRDKKLLPLGEYIALSKRGISMKTCNTMGYSVSSLGGKPCQVANFFESGKIIAQKIRLAGKEFRTLGVTNKLLWGKESCKGKRCIVIDRKSVV